MRTIYLLIALVTFNLSAQEIKKVDSERSIINYTGKHFLHKWSAENKNISGLIQIETETISNIGVIAKVSDFRSGNSNLDSNSLRVLDALKFPNVIFRSTAINQENGQIIIDGIIKQVESKSVSGSLEVRKITTGSARDYILMAAVGMISIFILIWGAS